MVPNVPRLQSHWALGSGVGDVFVLNKAYLMLVIWLCVFHSLCYVVIISTGSDMYG